MREVESGGDPTNVAEASVLVISSLMNIINLPFNEQNMKICFFVGPVSPASCVAQSQSEPEPSEYLLHIYNNWPLTGAAVCQSAPHITDHVWLRLRLSPGDHYRKCRSLEVCTRRFDTPMLGTNIEIRDAKGAMLLMQCSDISNSQPEVKLICFTLHFNSSWHPLRSPFALIRDAVIIFSN